MQALTPLEAAQLPLQEVLTRLSSASGGLTSAEVAHRRAYHGANVLGSADEEPLLKKFLEQFKDPMIALLLASACVSVLMGQYDDAFSIALAIVIVVTVAFVQEYRSDKSLEALGDLAPPTCRVLRDGFLTDILASEVVPGDVVVAASGDRFPADLRLMEAVDMEVDESSLTGETEPRRKDSAFVAADESVPLAERSCMAYMGTLLCTGRGSGVVVGTGGNTELGRVFGLMSEQEERKSPLQVRMDALGKRLSVASFAIIGVIVVIGLAQRKRLLDMFTIGVSLAVAAIPEGLPIVVTVTLALGVMRMARANAVVKKLPAVEALGCTTTVCVDKTGTLTRNEMTAVQLWTPGVGGALTFTGTGYDGASGRLLLDGAPLAAGAHPGVAHVLEIGALCNNSDVRDNKAVGQPTEAALVAAAQKAGLHGVRDAHVRLQELPFSSAVKWMAVKCSRAPAAASPPAADALRLPPGDRFYVKGSLDGVLGLCGLCLDADGCRPLTDADVARIRDAAASMASTGLRVLAMASGAVLPSSTVARGDPASLMFAGLVALHDAPREGVADAVATLRASSVAVVMITGDALETGVAIASKLGIVDNPVAGIVRRGAPAGADAGAGVQASPFAVDVEGGGHTSVAMSGSTVDQLSEAELSDAISGVRVFYRAAPRHKMKIVAALQRAGHVVAMTGDGVNDAPALKAADIGVAMGLAGTDVAKEASDMVLLDDNFATILAAIKEGKSIFYNIRNFVRFQLSTSIAALALVALANLFGLPTPLNAMQILWINIIMDGPPAQSLGVEPVDDDVMQRPPRRSLAPIITRSLLARVLASAAIIVVGTLWMFWREMSDGVVTSRDTTMTFTTFVMYDMFNALSCRSASKSVATIGLTSNRFFVYAVGGSLLGQLAVIYVPFLQAVFQTEAISFMDWVNIVALTCPVLIADEIRKAFARARNAPPGEERSSSFTRMLEDGRASPAAAAAVTTSGNTGSPMKRRGGHHV